MKRVYPNMLTSAYKSAGSTLRRLLTPLTTIRAFGANTSAAFARLGSLWINNLAATLRPTSRFATPSLKVTTVVGIGLLVVLLAATALPALAEIGEGARQRALESASVEKGVSTEEVSGLLSWIKILGAVLLLMVIVLFGLVAKLVDFTPLRKVSANNANGVAFILFGLLFVVYLVWEFKENVPNILPAAASLHGAEIDTLMNTTIIMTGIVFVVVQTLLFYFAYKYRSRKGSKAIYYHDNSKLETIWTIVPAVALAIIVTFGVTVWHNIHNPDLKGKKPLEIELVGEQFQWRIRYAGKDGVLGKHAFKKISAENPVGVDYTDNAAKDDVVPELKEIHIPLNQPVQFKIRSKDVLHGVFAPHFRVNIYAVPGMPTQFTFTPTKTTAQMRKETGNKEFNYELACSQLCGSSHYNMRVVIVVDSPKDYKKWLKKQPTLAKTISSFTQSVETEAQALTLK